MRFTKSILLQLLLVFIGGRLLMAGPILDQFSFESEARVCCGAGFFGNKELAQVFAVANTGILDEIDLVLANQWATVAGSNPNLFFDIRPVVAGTPVEDDSAALASREVAITSNARNQYGDANLVSLTSLGVSVTQGDVLAIVLRGGLNGAFTWLSGDQPYSGGSTYAIIFDHTWYGPYLNGAPYFGANAFAFQTFVDCADQNSCNPAVLPPPAPPVGPEPSSLVLGAIGMLGMLAFAGWRKHRL